MIKNIDTSLTVRQLKLVIDTITRTQYNVRKRWIELDIKRNMAIGLLKQKGKKYNAKY